MNAAQQYARLIAESRGLQLRNEAGAVARLEELLRETNAEIARSIRTTPKGILGERYRRDLLSKIDGLLDSFRAEYKDLLDGGIVAAAKIVEDRERSLIDAILKERGILQGDQTLSALATASRLQVQFGGASQLTLERAYARIYPDGLTLSKSLYNLDLAARRAIGDEVTRALAAGRSARDLAKRIEPHLLESGVDNIRYKARRIARSEINTAYREGYLAAVAPEGILPDYISAIGWRLSAAHSQLCICDVLAGDDTDGLGAGNYLPNNVPSVSHPHCRCYLVSILAAYPDRQYVSTLARPGEVSAAERKYYGFELVEI